MSLWFKKKKKFVILELKKLQARFLQLWIDKNNCIYLTSCLYIGGTHNTYLNIHKLPRNISLIKFTGSYNFFKVLKSFSYFYH